MKKLAILLLTMLASGLSARAERPRVYALTGARIITAPGQAIDSGTIVLRDGLIESVGKEVKPPADASILDATGKTVTAGFIDACTDIGQKKAEATVAAQPGPAGPPAPAREPRPGAVHPIARVHPEKDVVDTLLIDAALFEKHRAMGFTTAVTMPGEGILRGSAAVIDLGAEPLSGAVVRAKVGQVIGFDYSGAIRSYPDSLMGVIATIRQALLDAQREAIWSARYQANPAGMQRPDYLGAYGALAQVTSGRTPAIFDAEDPGNVQRAINISKEFALNAMIIGSGAESVERGAVSALKKAGYPLLLPLDFPDKPKVKDPDEALNVTLQDLEKWEAAPANPARLQDAGVGFALGTCRLDTPADFTTRLRQAIDKGLTAQTALAALTTAPAKYFGLDQSLGTLEAGKIANLVVFEGAAADGAGVFGEKSKPSQVFVDGVKFDIEKKKSKGDPDAVVDPRGTWSVTYTFGSRTINRAWTITGDKGDYSGTTETASGTVDFISIKLEGNELTVRVPGQGGRGDQEIVVVITGDTFEGSGESSSGGSFPVKGTRTVNPQGGAR